MRYDYQCRANVYIICTYQAVRVFLIWTVELDLVLLCHGEHRTPWIAQPLIQQGRFCSKIWMELVEEYLIVLNFPSALIPWDILLEQRLLDHLRIHSVQ